MDDSQGFWPTRAGNVARDGWRGSAVVGRGYPIHVVAERTHRVGARSHERSLRALVLCPRDPLRAARGLTAKARGGLLAGIRELRPGGPLRYSRPTPSSLGTPNNGRQRRTTHGAGGATTRHAGTNERSAGPGHHATQHRFSESRKTAVTTLRKGSRARRLPGATPERRSRTWRRGGRARGGRGLRISGRR